jgi:hypothetical protein
MSVSVNKPEDKPHKNIVHENREILVMVLFSPILAPKYEVPKLKHQNMSHSKN